MATSERISLQPVNSKEAGDGSLDEHTEPVEQDDTEDRQKVVASTQVPPTLVTVSQWKKVFITVDDRVHLHIAVCCHDCTFLSYRG